jgi:hypothetical protein
MQRIDSANAVPTMPAVKPTAAPGFFEDTSNPGTVVTADWLNDVQEELLTVIIAGGLTPAKGATDQLYLALEQLIANATAGVSSFNTRSGAVTLTNADIIAALAAGALLNSVLANMPAGTVKANPSGAAAAPEDITFAALATNLGYSKSGATSVTLPNAGDLPGTVGSSGSWTDPNGLVHQWAYIQLEDYGSGSGAYTTWTFPEVFPNACMGLVTQNYSVMAGQGGNSRIAIADVESLTAHAANIQMHNTTAGGTLCVFYVEAWGF